MKRAVGWAIVGKIGLYTGWSLTRREAIAEHVDDLYGAGPRHPYRLNDAQLNAWKECKKKGDRVVKVEILYEWSV